MNELISIVVPVYNTENYLNRCLESVVNQTYSNIQVILVDDGSTDGSGNMCDLWTTKDKRIEVIHKINGGLTSARKAGYDVAKGQYISFVDSDDYLEQSYVEDLYKDLIANDSDISICGYYLDNKNDCSKVNLVHHQNVFEGTSILNDLVLPSIHSLNSDKTALPNFLWLRLFKKELVNEKCFVSEREVYTEDLFFNIEALMNCQRVSIIDDCLYHYIVNSGSLTHIYRDNKCEMEIKRIKYIEKMLNQMSIDDKDRLSMVVIRSIWECVENAMRAGTYSKFVKNIKPFFSDLYMRNLKINPKLKQVTVSEKICYICFKYKLIFFVYLYKKAVAMIKK